MCSGNFIDIDDFILNKHLLPSLNTYIYVIDNKQYIYYSGILSNAFFSYKRFINPYQYNKEFTNENILQLVLCAKFWSDFVLLNAIDSINVLSNLYHHSLTLPSYLPLSSINLILHIGLYLLGWKGPHEPYPHKYIHISDYTRVALKIYPLLQSCDIQQYPIDIQNILQYLIENILSHNINHGYALVSYASSYIPYSSSITRLLSTNQEINS